MHGIRVRDLAPQGYLACDLRDFLDLLGEATDCSQWLVSEDTWAIGDRADELETLGDGLTRIPGSQLRALAGAVTQVIDGEFTGYKPAETRPWVVIRAVDSSFYEFFCCEATMLQKARESFRAIVECESDAKSGAT